MHTFHIRRYLIVFAVAVLAATEGSVAPVRVVAQQRPIVLDDSILRKFRAPHQLVEGRKRLAADVNGSAVYLFALLKMKLKMAARRRHARVSGAPARVSGALDAGEQANIPVVGSRVRFASGAERVVERIELPRIFVSGAPLDPERDGAPNTVMLIAEQAVMSTKSALLTFKPLEDPTQPCYVALRIARLNQEVRQTGIVWGAGGGALGQLNFELRGDGPQDYLLRVSSQASWARAACDWIEVRTPAGAIQLVSARLLAGD